MAMDVGRRLSNTSARESTLIIANAVFARECSTDRATRLLSSRGPFGQLFAAEIALEAAYDTQSWQHFDEFKAHTQDVMRQSTDRSSQLRAEYRWAQRDVHASLALEKSMPTKKSMKKAYERTVELGYDATRRVSRETNIRDLSDESVEMIGTTSEIAVGILATRTALMIDRDRADHERVSWLGVQSLFSQDHDNNCLNKSFGGWDMNIFTENGDGRPERTYKVQLKNSRKNFKGEENKETGDIALVCLQPDLATFFNEKNISRSIIIGAYHELANDVDLSRIAPELNERGERLLDKIDPPPKEDQFDL